MTSEIRAKRPLSRSNVVIQTELWQSRSCLSPTQ